jgi:hypothetical protein
MTKNIVSVAAALLSAGTLLTGCNFDQPNAGCIVQDASFANWVAQYDLKEGETISSECEGKVTIHGELLGVYKFTNPEKAGESVLTLRPQGLYSRATRDPGDPYLQTAVGGLEDETTNDFCGASGFSAATVNAGPKTTNPPEAATSITYQYDNVKVYAAPDAPGTQLTGDLTYTRDNCTAKYTVKAIWPAAPCDPDSTKESEKCGVGSGINPDFAVKCDTSFQINPNYPGTCVADKAIPSFTTER